MKEEIINHIKARRTGRRITQEDLATAVGVSRQSIISIERGRYIPSLPLAMRMAEFFGCGVNDLFERKG